MLPEHHLSSESKDVVKLAMGLIATMAALVLGLMTASAKSSFDIQNQESVHTAADIIRLDRALARYGPETKEIRELLKRAVAFRIHLTWPEDGSAPGNLDSPEMTRATEGLEDKIRELSPRNEVQRDIQVPSPADPQRLVGNALAKDCSVDRSGAVAIPGGIDLLAQHSLRHIWSFRTPQRNRHRRPRALCRGGFRLDLFDLGDAPAIRRVDEDLPCSDALRALPARTVI